MNKLGSYKNVDGLEPASGMLDLAREKGLYHKHMEQLFYFDSGIPHGVYACKVTLLEFYNNTA